MLSSIRPGKPVGNAYIESFSGRFRDECLNEHWFVSMRHARTLIEYCATSTTPSGLIGRSATCPVRNSPRGRQSF
ncbi:integrase core domain-containing protein [Cupriavidus plantarum]|uniref:integrase core domain-containing protein n=1 Tax=Cupriavidus plantarum TaxID=942865 RepID=UPI0038B2AB41